MNKVTLRSRTNESVEVVVLDGETATGMWYPKQVDAERRAIAERETIAAWMDVCHVAVRHAGAAWFVVIVHDHDGLNCDGSIDLPDVCHPDARVVVGDSGSLVCAVCGMPA